MDDLSERRLADRLMSVAETRSVRALGIACCSAIGELTGSPTVGLYLLEGPEPELAYCRHVPEGLLDNYKSGFWKCDPVLDCVLTEARCVDGASLTGAEHWRRSPSFEMLNAWGFAHNMAGPLWCGRKIAGVLFTAKVDAEAPYTALLRQRMDILCRAGSLALTNMMNAGEFEADRDAIMLRPHSAPPPSRLLNGLPPRSADVATRVCRGRTNKQIAREMGISDQTVKEHVANLCRRFGAHNRTELAACLMRGNQRSFQVLPANGDRPRIRRVARSVGNGCALTTPGSFEYRKGRLIIRSAGLAHSTRLENVASLAPHPGPGHMPQPSFPAVPTYMSVNTSLHFSDWAIRKRDS